MLSIHDMSIYTDSHTHGTSLRVIRVVTNNGTKIITISMHLRNANIRRRFPCVDTTCYIRSCMNRWDSHRRRSDRRLLDCPNTRPHRRHSFHRSNRHLDNSNSQWRHRMSHRVHSGRSVGIPDPIDPPDSLQITYQGTLSYRGSLKQLRSQNANNTV